MYQYFSILPVIFLSFSFYILKCCTQYNTEKHAFTKMPGRGDLALL